MNSGQTRRHRMGCFLDDTLVKNRKWHLEQWPVTVQIMSFLSFNLLIHSDVRLNTSRGSEIRSFMSITTIIGLMWTIIIDLL